jgi:4-hydroxybenzoate polyprenyltransferase
MLLLQTLSSVRSLWQAMRPHHWVKNVVVVAAPLFALAAGAEAWLNVAFAFLAFSMTASAFYLINDLRDVEADRQHPVKRHRPIAAGLVPAPLAGVVAGGLLIVSLAGSILVAPLLGLTLGVYAAVQAAYNLGLKHQPILDIMVVAAGFVLRALAGAAAAGVPVSGWFVLCIGLLAFFLGVQKRKAELRAVGDGGSTRAVLAFYSLAGLDRMESVATASALMAYALWTLEGAETPWMLATLPFVAYAIFRYQFLVERGAGETPEETLMRDPGMLLAVGAWAASALAILLISSP